MQPPVDGSAAQVLERPPELDGLDPGRSAVIEASAGTGKTYLLEHLVLELVISGRARLPEILVVTFTERATAELRTRIRQKIDQALTASDSSEVAEVADAARVVGWRIDEAARARLVEARQSFDQASIATIHSFCQGILTDQPFVTGRLLGQAQVDGLRVFSETFRDVLRRILTTDESHRSYLDAYLATGRTIDHLEELLYRASTARGQWANPYDEAAVARAAAEMGALKLDVLDLEKLLRRFLHPSSVGAMMKRLRRLVPEVQACGATRSWGRFLALLDEEPELFPYLETVAAIPDVPPTLAPLRRVAERLLDGAPPLDEAIAQRFLPPVQAALERRKLTEGLYDYDDMIGAVDAALGGPRGPELAAALRRRYRFALVDEAQDTEPAQWRIFRRVFLDSDAPNPVVLIADPKQAIYGFRGADVHTYVEARDEVRARGGTILQLVRNHRSHPEVIAAYNAILDHAAAEPFFTDPGINYDAPVTSVLGPLGDGPGVTLFRVEAPVDESPGASKNAPGAAPGVVRIGPIKRALADAITTTIAGLGARRPPPRLSRIFVLTRSNAEARDIASRLHEAGIPNALFRPDDIFASAEATHVRALLAAIVDPTDRAARLSAWLTPFFDVSLAELAADPDPPPDHPLMARLLAWKGLGDTRAYDQLWARILDDSGVTRRLRLAPAGLRRLTNYRHLFDVLLAETGARPISLEDLAALLGAFAAGHRRPAGDDEDTQRLETEADAVRISTIHAAKGLEADTVFIYGGLSARRIWRGQVHVFNRASDGLRVICAGKPRRKAISERIDAARYQEDQRLLYVALTRARQHLYLPFFPTVEPDESDFGSDGGGDFDAFKKISGPYRHVNQRLRALTGQPQRLFASQAIALGGPGRPGDESLLAALGAWAPSPDLLDRQQDLSHDDPSADLSQTAGLLRARRRGFVITSYSRIKEGRGQALSAPSAAQPDQIDRLDDVAARILDPVESQDAPLASVPPTEPGDPLPGGAASGLFLHAVLEKVALGELPPLSTWQGQPEVRTLIEAQLRRWDRDPRHFAPAARLIHAALTAPIELPAAPTLPGISRAARVRREVDFLFPLPDHVAALAASAEDRLLHVGGFVRGFIDVLFEHGGRICFADWKSDVLPAYGADALATRIDAHYQLQIQLYTLALVRMLGIDNRRDYDARFGGLVYLFLRGLATGSPARAPTDGIYVARPDYGDVERWNRELGQLTILGALPVTTTAAASPLALAPRDGGGR